MKKLLVTVATFAMLLTISGCAKEKKEPTAPPATVATKTTPSESEDAGSGSGGSPAPTFDKQAAYDSAAQAFITLKRLSHSGGCDREYKAYVGELSTLATKRWIEENVTPWDGVKKCSSRKGSFSFNLVGTPFDAYGADSNQDRVVTEFQYEMKYNSPNEFKSNGMRDRKMNIQVEAVKSGGGYLIDKTGTPDSLKQKDTDSGGGFGYDPDTGKWYK